MNKDIAVLNVFRKGAVLTPADVATATGLDIHPVYDLLARLARNGNLEKVGRGQYKLPPRRPLASVHDTDPVELVKVEETTVVPDEPTEVVRITEIVLVDLNFSGACLALALWSGAGKYDDRTMLDADIMREAIEHGFGIQDIQQALTMLGTEPMVVHNVPATRFPGGKLLLSLG